MIKSALLSFIAAVPAGLFAQTVTYSFSTGGATGQNGPSQAQINTAYSATNLNGSVTVTGGIQTFTIPATGDYRIIAAGAAGGGMVNNLGCRGRIVEGDINLQAGTVLRILVGQRGVEGVVSNNNSAGGGGGTYVVDFANNTPIIVGGGGAGYYLPLGSSVPSSDGSYGNSGQNSLCGSGTGGSGGNGGNGSSGGWGGGGGGFATNGTQGSACSGSGGVSFLNGGTGGGTCYQALGGFGGGGGSHGNTGGGGGGGGYSGGGGSNQNINPNAGGGGGSYQAPAMFNLADGGFNTGEGYVRIIKLCSVNIAASANPICEGGSVTLTTDAVSNISWSGGSSNTSINVSPSVTTTYSVTGTSTANCITSSFITVTVNPLPQIYTQSSPSVVCVGGVANLSAGGAATYVWTGISSGANVTVAPASSGVYSVTGTSAAGCVNSATVDVTVNTNSLTVSPPSTVCLGKSVNISASGAVTYTWSTNSIFASIPVSPATSTTYVVSGVDVHNCVLSNTVNVAVVPNPNVTASSSKQTVCKGEAVTLNAGGASTYTWNNGDTGASVTYTLPIDLPYSYTVTGVDANGCSNTATTVVMVSKCTGIEENTVSSLNIFPNPGTGLFSVNAGNTAPGANIRVYNALGALVKTQVLNAGNNELDLRSEANGVYFIYLSEKNKEVQSFKLIKH